MMVRREVLRLLMFILVTKAIFILFIISLKIPFEITLVLSGFLAVSALGLIIAYFVFRKLLV